jgi:Secretion system C-terminal sorting domain
MGKMLLCASLVLSLFSTRSVSAQVTAPAIQWDKTLGGANYEGFSTVAHTSDGGSIVASYSASETISGNKTENNVGFGDIWVVKLDASGVIQWQNALGGYYDETAKTIKQTADGGYIIGGSSESPISGDKTDNNRGEGDYWVVKLDANGTVQWDKTFGGSRNDLLQDVAQTADGGFIVGGYSNSLISGEKSVNSNVDDFWVLKLNAAGTIEWEKTLGMAGTDNLTSVCQTADGGYILGGFTYVPMGNVADPITRYGDNDYYIMKLDALGTKLWQKTYGGSGSDLLQTVQQTPDGGYILGGFSNSTLSGVKTEGRLGTDGDFWVIKTDAVGTIQWQNTIGGNSLDFLTTLVQTTDGGYALGGYSTSTPSFDKSSANKGGKDYWLVKVDALGALEWEKSFGTSGVDYMDEMDILADGTLILTGVSTANIGGDKTENAYGEEDLWVVKLGLPQPSLTPSVSDKFLCLNALVSPLTAVGQNLLWYTTPTGGVGSTIAPTPSTATVGITSYYVSQTVNNVESQRVEIKVTVYALPTAAIIANSSTCQGVSVALRATGGVSYVWGQNGSTSANIYSTPSVTTTYSMTATDVNGCKATATHTITVIPMPNVAVLGLASICRNSATTLTATGGNSYRWNNSATTASITVAPTVTTSYFVTVTQGSCTKVLMKTLTVNVPPTVTITNLNTQYAQNAAAVTMTGSPINGVFRVDNVITSVFNPANLSIGNHTVTYTVTQGACTVVSTKMVGIVAPILNLQSNNTGSNVNPTFGNNRNKLEAYNAQNIEGANFSNEENMMNSDAKTLKINKLSNIQLSPNPATSYVDVNLESYVGESATLLIYNYLGQIMVTQKLNEVPNATQRIDVSKFQAGNYVLRVSSSQKDDRIIKFVVSQ